MKKICFRLKKKKKKHQRVILSLATASLSSSLLFRTIRVLAQWGRRIMWYYFFFLETRPNGSDKKNRSQLLHRTFSISFIADSELSYRAYNEPLTVNCLDNRFVLLSLQHYHKHFALIAINCSRDDFSRVIKQLRFISNWRPLLITGQTIRVLSYQFTDPFQSLVYVIFWTQMPTRRLHRIHSNNTDFPHSSVVGI